MITKDKFLFIKENYGHYASWAIWADKGKREKENVGDLSMFEEENLITTLPLLNPNIVLVGLNISGKIEIPYGNFHSGNSNGQDYKLRNVLKNTPLWGGYITDIIKDFEEKISGKVASYLKQNKDFEKENIEIFLKELEDIESVNPIIIALGNDSYNILNRNLKGKYKIFKISHYSRAISFQNYKKEVDNIIDNLYNS